MLVKRFLDIFFISESVLMNDIHLTKINVKIITKFMIWIFSLVYCFNARFHLVDLLNRNTNVIWFYIVGNTRLIVLGTYFNINKSLN